jgi:hypothetical protein
MKENKIKRFNENSELNISDVRSGKEEELWRTIDKLSSLSSEEREFFINDSDIVIYKFHETSKELQKLVSLIKNSDRV